MTTRAMRVLVTGAKGFIGKNLTRRLRERDDAYTVVEFTRDDAVASLPALLADADAVVHLAGENRPKDAQDFTRVNTQLTQSLCDAVKASGRLIPVLLASSTQAELASPYGLSKLAAEQAIEGLAGQTGNPVCIYRLPGVFGKWCKPNYNSVVATFCYQIARGQDIQIRDEAARIRLVYVDDVVNEFISMLARIQPGLQRSQISPEYDISLGELAEQIQAFKHCRTSLVTERVGGGLTRALYATYVSYLPADQFCYNIPRYGDERGVFVEMLKTQDSGQFSYFTAHPGITRGSHYHHSKTEKFLVIKGQARFRFRHLLTNETYELLTSGDVPQVVDTIPGWAHDITNVGHEEMVVMLWANEIFDRDRPDTIGCKV